MKNFCAKAILTAACMAFTVCDGPVGLGEKILMNGPIVTIGEPTPDRALLQTDPIVGTLFMLSGTARDELRVTSMLITLDYWNSVSQELVRMGRSWRWDGKWLTRESDGAPWRPYTNADYNLADANPEETITDPSWKVYNKNDVSWSLPLFMNRMEKGDYFINVGAWNAAGRHDARSAAKLQIRYNNQAPSVRIVNPVLLAGGGSLAAPEPPSWDSYVFDPFNRPEETSLNARYYTNSFRDLSYYIDYTNSPPNSLSFEIANEHNLDEFGEEKIVYYGWQWTGPVVSLPQRGIFTDRSGAVGAAIDAYVKAGDMIVLDEEIRESLPPDSVTPMQLVSRVRDATGFEEYKSKGWFLYLPDSDKPYPDINFAHKVHKDANATPPADAAELASMVRGSANYNSLVYDDDGVKELQWNLYKLKDSGFEVDKLSDSAVIAFDGNKKATWSFNANKSYGTGRFKIEVRAQDIYDTWGDYYYGYFTITSNSTPTVVTPLVSPDSLTATFWGDTNGNITIAGKAQIEDFDDCDGIDHGVRVHEIAIVWLKPGLGVENNFRYADSNDPLWKASSATSFTDVHGNKIWKTGVTFVPATTGNNNGNFQEDWAFSQTLNYFTDLDVGIGKIALGDQQFRIRVEGGEQSPDARRSSVYSFITRGDMAAPVLEVTEILVQHGALTTSYTLGSYNMLPPIAQNDKIMLRGEWSDDSIAAWAGLGANRHTEYLSPLSVQWSGETNNINFDIESFTLTAQNGGNWETGWYTFADHNTDPIVQVTASLTDISGRPGVGNAVLVVETTEAVLVRVSSAHSDGYYGENKQTVADDPASRYIDLFLEFNKPVTFLPATGAPALTYANAPRLALNNGGEAFYQAGSGTSRIVFRYFVNGIVNPPLSTAIAGKGGGNSPVEQGNSEGRLNVSALNFNGFGEGEWQSLTGIPAVFNRDGSGSLNVCVASNIFSLVGQKRIIIDKTPPAITGVSTSAWTHTNHGRDSQINIEVKFNKNVSITGATGANTYLTLVGGNLDTLSARAGFEHSKDSSTLNFLYTVLSNHDTSAYDQFLGVSNAIFGAPVTDAAGNTLSATVAIPGSPAYLNGIVIDTRPPTAPIIFGINSQTYYSGASFYIAGLEPGGGAVEYHLNHPASGEATTGWTPYAGVISGGQTGSIPLTLDGTYNIAARQYDTATTPNMSPRSLIVGPVRLDSGAVLERLRSSLPDGSYSAEVPAKNTITIDLEFRIPVTLAGEYSATNLPPVDVASIVLNAFGPWPANSGNNRARLSSAPANSKKWTFEYVIPQGARTQIDGYLDVDALNLDGIVINDQYGTRVNGPGGWIKLSDVAPENTFISQKKIKILSGRPYAVNGILGSGVLFNGTQLRIIFDREIYRGRTAEKLIIRQIDDGYRIPAALSEDQFNNAFINREDMFTVQSSVFGIAPPLGTGSLSVSDITLYNQWRDGSGERAGTWRSFGEKLYQIGYNGATPQQVPNAPAGWVTLVSDTTPKYILNYDADPDDNNFTEEVVVSGATKRTSMNLLRTAYRASEALSFGISDREVTINGRYLTIDLSASGRPLPVKGARYEWVFPNGFVQDALGTAQGTGDIDNAAPVGRDTNLTSGTTPDGARVLFHSGAAEPPVIRIDKGADIPTFNNSTANRHALQPLTARVKINSRTPNATITYWLDQISNSVSFRDIDAHMSGGASQTFHFQHYLDDRAADFSTDWNYGYNGAVLTGPKNYTSELTIGSADYRDGGMIIYIRARSAAPLVTNTANDYGYEAAYRSVLLYDNYPSFYVQMSSHYAGSSWTEVNEYLSYEVIVAPIDYTNFVEASVIQDIPRTHLHLLSRVLNLTVETPMREGSVNNNTFINYRKFVYNNTYSNSGLDRVWIRGSNTPTGDASIPAFPLSRDLSKSRKAMPLTPLNITATPKYNKIVTQEINGTYTYKNPETMITTHLFYGYTFGSIPGALYYPTLTAANIPTGAVGTGNYLWAYVTWKLNVPAYVELLYGELPSSASDPYQTPRTNLRYVLNSSQDQSSTHTINPGRITYINLGLGLPYGGTSNIPVHTDTESAMEPQQNYYLGDTFTPPPRSD